MLRTDKIIVKVDEKSRFSIEKVQQILEVSLNVAASATKYTMLPQEERKIEVILERFISLPTVNKILNAFSKARIIIQDVHWVREEIGPFRRGNLEISIF